jgi:hypothetical protein
MNIWTGLLFLEGAVADVALARELDRDEVRSVTGDFAAAVAQPDSPRTAPSYPRTPQGAH